MDPIVTALLSTCIMNKFIEPRHTISIYNKNVAVKIDSSMNNCLFVNAFVNFFEIPYSAKCWRSETLAKSLYSCIWKVKLWRIE